MLDASFDEELRRFIRLKPGRFWVFFSLQRDITLFIKKSL